MPTPLATHKDDIARRLQEISTLLSLIKVMAQEPLRTSAINHLWLAVEDLCDVPDDDHHHKSRLVRALFLLAKKLRALSDPQTWDDDISMLFEVISLLTEKLHSDALALMMPTYTNLKGQAIMASFPLALNKIATFTITEMNTVTGTFDPVDPTDVFTLVNSDPVNLNAVVGVNAAGGPAVVVNWLHTVDPLLVGVGVTISDSKGNTMDTQLFDMVQPAAIPDQIGLDIANVTTADQPVPV